MVLALVSHPENCTGCRFCEMICSLYHEGVVNTKKARLRVMKPDLLRDIPLVCTQCLTCGDNCCIQACPEMAISVVDGLVLIDEGLCSGCGNCKKVCPYGVIWMDKLAHKCDLCGGDPMCVKFCPSGALTFEEANEDSYTSMIATWGDE